MSPVPVQTGLSPSNTIPTPDHVAGARGTIGGACEPISQQESPFSSLRGFAGSTVEGLRAKLTAARVGSPLGSSSMQGSPSIAANSSPSLRWLPPRPNSPSNHQSPLPVDGLCTPPPSTEPPDLPAPVAPVNNGGSGVCSSSPATLLFARTRTKFGYLRGGVISRTSRGGALREIKKGK